MAAISRWNISSHFLCQHKFLHNQPNTDPVSENIKAVLGNLRGISTKLAEIRNPYGSGHGKSASFTGVETRHAKLAVGCSITFVTFLWDTYEGGAS